MATEAVEEDDSRRVRRRQVSHPRSASTDSIPNFRDKAEGIEASVGAVRPQNPERKKGFLRSMLIRK